jgi:chromate transporter
MSQLKSEAMATIFGTFFRIGLLGFGGVLAVSRIELVDKKRWVSESEFVQMLGICNFLPGANVVSLAVFVGGIRAGFLGSIAAFLGLISAPIAIIILLVSSYPIMSRSPLFQSSLSWMASCGAGIIVAIALRLFSELPKLKRYLAIVLVLVTCISFFGFSIIPVVLVMAPVAVLLEARSTHE